MTHDLSILDALVLHVLGQGTRTRSQPRLTPPTPAACEDREAISLAQGGRADARAALVRELQDVWYRYALSMLRSPDQARDATQETALRFLKGLNQFRGDSKLKTWSLGIATNVCRERRRQRPTLALSETHAENTDQAPGPRQKAELKEQRDRLLAVLGDLPDRQREAVALRYFEQLSVRDTAAAMGCAEGTVKATLSQAIRSLRRRMEADNG
ncbi:sigma-70 family RNA polymerase sigma factor [Phycisphaeraceae bacterium D3-23]